MVCDDRPEVREAIVRAVGALTGYRVVGEAADGDECLARIADLRPDILTLDIGMPGGGPDLVSAIKAMQPAPYIVVFSARDEDRLREKMLDAGADRYVLKSGRLSPLILALQQALAEDRRDPAAAPEPASEN